MIVNLVYSATKDDNEIYFYSQLDNDLDESFGVYLINKNKTNQIKYFLCENANKCDFDILIKNDFKLYYDVETYGITAILLLDTYNEISIKLKTISSCENDFKNKLDNLIGFTKNTTNTKKRKIEVTFPKIIQNYYCDRCEEDSTRFDCDDSKCYANQKAKLIKQNKLKSYCNTCEEDSTIFVCGDYKCKNYCREA